MIFEKVSIIGLGYIGLPTAALLASKNKNVVGVDINPEIVETINNAKVHIVEEDLESLVFEAVKNGRLIAKNRPEQSDVFIIAVPTPLNKEKDALPEPDISHIQDAMKEVALVLKKGDLIILESTCPVGTTEQISKFLSSLRKDLSFPHNSNKNSEINIAYCPERVLPGSILKELVSNDRVVGGVSEPCSIRAKDFYLEFVKADIFTTDSRTAEMVKLTENSCRDVQIAFANELSVICDELNINTWDLITLANKHPRINILQPGPGVGGHCIAVDPWFIINSVPELSKLIRTARYVNDEKPNWVIKKINQLMDKYLAENDTLSSEDVTVVFYGLTFKANVDDFRESPSLIIAQKFAAQHEGVTLAIEPYSNSKTKLFSNNIKLVDMEDGLKENGIHVLLVEHREFIGQRPDSKYILDFKGIWTND